MRIFVSEYLCCGAWPDAILPSSLADEGRAMLISLLQDLNSIDSVSTITTWDQRLGEFPNDCGECVVTQSPQQEWELFQSFSCDSQNVIVIAPEFDHILEDRIAWLHDNHCHSWVSSLSATQLFSDKWQTYQFLEQNNLPTIPTEIISDHAVPSFPGLIKPRDGAGSVGITLVTNQEEWERWTYEHTAEMHSGSWILQPLISGESFSTACIVSPESKKWYLLPITQQVIDPVTFQYRGGIVPIVNQSVPLIHDLINTILDIIPEYQGYLGIDFLYQPELEESLRIVEINPRLTTSYIGYREHCKLNLARIFCGLNPGKLSWKNDQIEFTSNGKIIRGNRDSLS